MTNGRFFKQALETLNNNDCKPGDIIDAYNQKVIQGGYHPLLQHDQRDSKPLFWWLWRIIRYARQDNCSRISEPGKGSSGQGPSSIGWGYLSSDKSNRLQRSSESACGIYDPYNKALYRMICPTLLASDYKHLKYVIEEADGS